MAYPVNERGVVRLVTDRIINKHPGAWVLKTQSTGYQRTGVPDLLVCVDGKFLGIEVKHRKPGESVEHMMQRVSPSQWDELRKLEEAGAVAGVVWDEETLDNLLELLTVI